MKRLLCLLLIACLAAPAAADALTPAEVAFYLGETNDWIFGWCQQVNPVAGGYEYWIDIYTNGVNEGWGYWMGGFDVAGVQNIADAPYVRDIWSAENFGRGTDIEMPTDVHVIEDYGTDGWSAYRTATADTTVAGGPPTAPPVGDVWTDRMWMLNWSGATGGMNPGLLMTWRLVFDQQYYDGDLWVTTSWLGPATVFNLPDGGIPGDFDGDDDIDADDVDILCANMGGDPATYDLDGDGDVDEDDMIFLVEDLIEYDTNGDGTPDGNGTYRGDFNLDGVVNATDLQIMKGSFGSSGVGYASGNANCDTVVNATDLQILKDAFGSSASAVPEPLTVGLLALGGAALLKRRSH